MKCCAQIATDPKTHEPVICDNNAKYLFTDETGEYPYCWLHGPLMLRDWPTYPLIVERPKEGNVCNIKVTDKKPPQKEAVREVPKADQRAASQAVR